MSETVVYIKEEVVDCSQNNAIENEDVGMDHKISDDHRILDDQWCKLNGSKSLWIKRGFEKARSDAKGRGDKVFSSNNFWTIFLMTSKSLRIPLIIH